LGISPRQPTNQADQYRQSQDQALLHRFYSYLTTVFTVWRLLVTAAPSYHSQDGREQHPSSDTPHPDPRITPLWGHNLE